MASRLRTAAEMENEYGIPRDRLYELVRRRVIPPGAVVRLGRQVRFNPELFDRWISSRTSRLLWLARWP